MFVLARALTYSSLFIGFLLVFLPARILSRAGIERPSSFGTVQAIGSVFGITGVFLAIWCILTFVLEGRGTPAPFDPPRQLVANGPYRFVRSPMYLGALFALVGAALYFGSWGLLGYGVVFGVAAQVFVLAYEEPILRRTFGRAYEEYCRSVPRWVPRWP